MKRWLVAAFVGFHLAFLAFRNPVSLKQQAFDRWVADARQRGGARAALATALDRVDRIFIAYEHALGLDQGWRMFGAPLDRAPAFPAVVLELSDGSRVELRSENEPATPHDFAWRRARPRLRKHETLIASSELEEMGLGEYWERYLVHRCKSWRKSHPADPRRVREIALLRRAHPIAPPKERSAALGVRSDLIGSMAGTACES